MKVHSLEAFVRKPPNVFWLNFSSHFYTWRSQYNDSVRYGWLVNIGSIPHRKKRLFFPLFFTFLVPHSSWREPRLLCRSYRNLFPYSWLVTCNPVPRLWMRRTITPVPHTPPCRCVYAQGKNVRFYVTLNFVIWISFWRLSIQYHPYCAWHPYTISRIFTLLLTQFYYMAGIRINSLCVNCSWTVFLFEEYLDTKRYVECGVL